MVGLMVAQDAVGNPLWRCGGALISPTVFLTAGHCTYGADHIEIWFDGDVASGIPSHGYPFHGDVGGEPSTHPDYPKGSFVLADVGRAQAVPASAIPAARTSSAQVSWLAA